MSTITTINKYLGLDVTWVTQNPFTHSELTRDMKLHIGQKDFEKYILRHPLVRNTPFRDVYFGILLEVSREESNIFRLNGLGYPEPVMGYLEIHVKELHFKIYSKDMEPFIGE